MRYIRTSFANMFPPSSVSTFFTANNLTRYKRILKWCSDWTSALLRRIKAGSYRHRSRMALGVSTMDAVVGFLEEVAVPPNRPTVVLSMKYFRVGSGTRRSKISG